MHLLVPWFGDTFVGVPEQIFMIRVPTIIACCVFWLTLVFKIYKLIKKNWFSVSAMKNKPEGSLVASDKTCLQKFFTAVHAKEPIEKLFNSNGSYQKLMLKSSFYKEVDGMLNPIRHDTHFTNLWWRILRKLNYKPKYGYKYPTRVLCGIFCTLVLMWDGMSILCWSLIPGINDLITNAPSIGESGADLSLLLQNFGAITNTSYFSDPDRVTEYIVDSITIIYASFIIAMVLAVLNCFLGIFWHFKIFRFHSRRVRRGYRSEIPTDKLNSFSCISAAMKYGAYICAYPIWGLMFQFTLWFIVLTLIIEIFILPIKIDGANAWLVQLLYRSWPGWLYTALVIVIQMVLRLSRAELL